jgi:hypothetical protein
MIPACRFRTSSLGNIGFRMAADLPAGASASAATRSIR